MNIAGAYRTRITYHRPSPAFSQTVGEPTSLAEPRIKYLKGLTADTLENKLPYHGARNPTEIG